MPRLPDVLAQIGLAGLGTVPVAAVRPQGPTRPAASAKGEALLGVRALREAVSQVPKGA
jgi:hypothetical protein